MNFDLNRWQQGVRRRLPRMRAGMRYLGVESVDGYLALLTLLPVAQALAEGQEGALSLFLRVAGGVGGEVLVEQVRRLQGRVTERELLGEVANLLAKQAGERVEVRGALDALFKRLNIMSILPDKERNWLRQELMTQYRALNIAGANAQGTNATALARQAMQVGGNVGGHVLGAGATLTTYQQGQVQPQASALREAYLSRLWRMAGYLPLEGVDPRATSQGAEPQLALDAVYTALLTHSYEQEVLWQEAHLSRRAPERGLARLSALQLLDQHHRLVLLGAPGSGKSTFVNFVALCLAGEGIGHREANLALLTTPLPNEEGQEKGERQVWRHKMLLPVRVILRDFAAHGLPKADEEAGAVALWRFIQADLKRDNLADYAPLLRKELLERGGLLLLDGLDEVPEAKERRTQLKRVVEGFAQSYPRCRILVTSRTYAYQQQAWRLNDFEVAELAPFSRGQIRCFVERWYAHVAERRGMTQTQGRAELLKRAIFSNTNLLEFAERPLLLTLMASLHAWRGGSLPENREELYANAVELLLDSWERQRMVLDADGNVRLIQPSLSEWLKVDQIQVRRLLERLAYEAHHSQPELVGTADIPEGTLLSGLLRLTANRSMDIKQLIKYLSQRAGLLLPRGVEVYTFPHRTFQEYLAACYLTGADYPDYPDGLADLVRQEPNRWREVALLAAAKATRGAASSLWYLVGALCYREVNNPNATVGDLWGAYLAGQALVENRITTAVSERHQPKLTRVKHWLVHLLEGSQLPPIERAQAGITLAHLGDPRPEVMSVDQMQFCYVPPGPFWMGSNDGGHNNKPLHQVNLPDGYWIGRYPVTNAQFMQFVEDGGYQQEPFWLEAKAANVWKDGLVRGDDRPRDYGAPFNLPNHPVVGVTWYEALAFTRWLSKRWGSQISLPSEAQWEKAARGGLMIPTTPLIRAANALDIPEDFEKKITENPLPQRGNSWGDDGDSSYTNVGETGIGHTSAVGCFNQDKSPFGCLEMAGNVLEWTSSLYQPYPYQLHGNKEDLNAPRSEYRVFRGVDWFYNSSIGVGCSLRYGNVPFNRANIRGFRAFCPPHLCPLVPLGSDL